MGESKGTVQDQGAPTTDKAQARDWRRIRDISASVLIWLVFIGFAFWLIQHLIGTLLILVLGAILAYALSPGVSLLERFMPRFLAIIIIYLGVLSVLGGVGYLVFTTALSEGTILLAKIKEIASPGQDSELKKFIDGLRAFGVTDAQIKQALDGVTAQASAASANLVPLAASVLDGVVRGILVGVLSVYLMVDGPRVVRWLRNNSPLGQRPRMNFFVDTLDRVVGGYVRGQLLLCTLIGVLVGIGMWIFHVPYAAFLGVLAFVLEFVPIVGVFISGAVCVVLAFSAQGWLTAVLVLGYFVVVHIIEGDVVGPRVMGRAVGLHPAIGILALFAGSEVFGIWGALFAAPVAGVIQALLTTVWINWREAHPEQFPTGYTADADLAIVPVTHTEPGAMLTVEPSATASAPEPMRAEAPEGASLSDALPPQDATSDPASARR